MRSRRLLAVSVTVLACWFGVAAPAVVPAMAQDPSPDTTQNATADATSEASPGPTVEPSARLTDDLGASVPGPDGVAEGLSLVDSPPAGWPDVPMATARSVMVTDATTGQVLAAVEADERVSVASTVKLLTVLTALEVLEPDQMVTVGPEVEIGGSTAALDPGDTWSVRDLVAGALIRSGNDAAEALAVAAGEGDRAAFIAMMQARAEELGIRGATIVDPSGLEDTNRMSAHDLSILADAALEHRLVAEIAASRSWDLPSTGPVPNRNLLLERRDDATGLKTGTTDMAGASLVGSIGVDGHDVVAVVLGTRNDSQRYAEAVEVFEWVEREFALRSVTVGASIRLPGRWVGETATVELWAPEAPTVETRVAVDGSSVVSEIASGSVGGRLGEYVATADVAPPGSVGQSVAGKLYEAMRQAHEVGAWSS